MKYKIFFISAFLFCFSAQADIFYRSISVEPQNLDLSYQADNPINGYWLSDDLKISTGFGNGISLLPTYGIVLKLDIPRHLVERTDNGHFRLPYKNVRALGDFVIMIGLFTRSTLTVPSRLDVEHWYTLEEFRKIYPNAKL